MRAPKLRFKDEDGKEFPEWKRSKLNKFVQFFNGDRGKNYPDSSSYILDGIPFINAGDLVNGEVNLDDCKKINEKKYNQLGGAKLTNGDILYCLRGSIGKNAIVKNIDKGTIASSLVVIRPTTIQSRYLFYILNSDIEVKQRKQASNGLAQPNLSAQDLGKFFIPIPSSLEQVKIANFLSAIDDRIAHINKKLELLKTYKKGMMQKIFSQEIRFKDENGEKFPEWEEKELGQFTDVLTGNPFKSEDFVEDGIRLLRGMNVKRNMIDWNLESTRFWSRNINNKIKKYNLQEKDVVIAMDGALVGRSYAMIQKKDIPSLLVQRVARLRSDIVSTSFIFYLIDNSSFANYVDKVKTQTAIPHISIQDIKNYSVCLPESKKEQTKIANFLSAIDDKITLVEKQLASTKAYKKGLMQQLFI